MWLAMEEMAIDLPVTVHNNPIFEWEDRKECRGASERALREPAVVFLDEMKSMFRKKSTHLERAYNLFKIFIQRYIRSTKRAISRCHVVLNGLLVKRKQYFPVWRTKEGRVQFSLLKRTEHTIMVLPQSFLNDYHRFQGGF